ncbi:hypothetical protein A2625_06025 [candidate division WOR-1 bacterium RIFCSPHIGHO2_01_FULL_53_15]|uniref:Bacterial repeat domain-containing protein n=1 Tax=candidate division WOR-1 bacterium RIFCSPHIGHO2_01_FULL_53_15 TaxID=1802564 RepID=A0A1F4Q1B5_UNCSA|nr:MAG: hypothetical protein A2625_06025 [candidate division WOR-1 bacterium RIFCSPHIGHO2_01_FULL_53_15]OGC13852.1 MAG: hypothetical protein A3D23_02195 [candidate division WOR-1 bacterium RIFCSPHIGHO2_02_FULL_53_26]
MRKVFLFSIFCFLLSTFCFAEASIKFEEQFRIKVWNEAGGTIEVSADKGKNWETVGHVVYPTARVNPEGYTASRWVADGTVAATAVNAIHLKVTTEATTGGGVIFSLLPKEFIQPPKFYRSYLSPDSSIYTDIPAGTSIFGDGYSPYVGNPVLLSRGAYKLVPMSGYAPAVGDRIYIIVEKPLDYPREIVFENAVGGDVTITYFSGIDKVIGKVLRPVIGVGRFEGTKYASVGRIRADHAGVIDVSTSRLRRIGGFQIVPSKHGAGMKYVQTATQWLVVGPVDETAALEGQPPLFKYFIKPVFGENDALSEEWRAKLLDRFLVEVKLDGQEKWQTMPVFEFNEFDLSGRVPAWADSALADVAALRILFPIKE